MEYQDESADEWADRSLDEAERYQRAADRDEAMSSWSNLGAAGGAAALVAFLLYVGRWLYRTIRGGGR